MNPDNLRPEARAIGGRVHIFIGSSWQALPIEVAEALYPKIAEAIEQAKQQEAVKA